MLDFKEILMTDILCSICMYLVCYKLSILLAYPYFSYCCMNCDDCTLYTSVGADAGLGAPKDDMSLNRCSFCLVYMF